MALFSKGITLVQHKEPALSRDLVQFTNPHPETFSLPSSIPDNMDDLSVEDIITIAKTAKIYDESDGRLLASKLRRMKNKAEKVYIDAVDDEPYVSSKMNPMINLSDELITGMELCAKVAGTDNIKVLVYKSLTDLQATIPRKIGGYDIVRLRGGYPALPSASQLSKLSVGKQMLVGTGAAIHLARAVQERKPQTTTFVTVHGNCIANPMNLEVSLGMNVTEILERCGLIQEPTRVVSGGSMTGISIIDTNTTLVTPTTRALLAFREKERDRAYSCIGCARCEKFCPSGLNPMYLYKFVATSNYEQMPLYDAHYCIGCGTCSYVCPSRLNVSGAAQKAKQYAIKNFNIDVKLDEEDEFET